jgi:Flp pilus assembly pilin Flp
MIREIAVRLRALIAREDGQDLIEYGLLAALVALACVVALGTVGETLNALWWEPISGELGAL